MTRACTLTIYGRVQGVGFRFYAQQKAQELNISGFVQNRPDGSVYIEAEGEETQLQAFINWCQAGPQWARVLELKIADMPPLGANRFVIR
jgi:acylphosphatase